MAQGQKDSRWKAGARCTVSSSLLGILLVACWQLPTATAFTAPSHASNVPLRELTMMSGYIPDGLTADEWDKIKKKERQQRRDLGRSGARGFQSRSMQSFQEALEKGEAQHLMPVDPRLVREGKIKAEDVPYMQRGGSWCV